MAKTAATRLVIRSQLAEASDVQRRILSEVGEAGYSENARFAIRLALDEAISNAIHHGNADDPQKRVAIEYTIGEDAVRITVEDEGCGFCPDHVPDPTCEQNLLKPHGRGVMLIKAYMTEVNYNRQGNRVTMVKRRNCCLPMSGA